MAGSPILLVEASIFGPALAEEILSSSAAQKWLSDQSPAEMEGLLRAVLVPSRGGDGRLRCDARELQCPFFLGCKPSSGLPACVEPGHVLMDPPEATGVKARLWWELVFLRLGARFQLGNVQVRLPKGLFALPGIAGDLRALLDFYIKSAVDLRDLRSRCEIEDRSGHVRCVPGEPEKQNYTERFLSQKFLPITGPEHVVDVEDTPELRAVANQLLAVIVDPTCTVVLALLSRAAKQGTSNLMRAYSLLAEGWSNLELQECAELRELRQQGLWIVAEDGQIRCKPQAQVCREDVERTFASKEVEAKITCFFVHGLCVEMAPPPDGHAASSGPASATLPWEGTGSKTGGKDIGGEQGWAEKSESTKPPSQPSAKPVPSGMKLPKLPQLRDAGGGLEVGEVMPDQRPFARCWTRCRCSASSLRTSSGRVAETSDSSVARCLPGLSCPWASSSSHRHQSPPSLSMAVSRGAEFRLLPKT